MNDSQKELVAIGASVTAHCMPCLEYHIGKALALDLSDEEIDQAIAIGQMVNRGATVKYDEFIKAQRKGKRQEDEGGRSGCGGGADAG